MSILYLNNICRMDIIREDSSGLTILYDKINKRLIIIKLFGLKDGLNSLSNENLSYVNGKFNIYDGRAIVNSTVTYIDNVTEENVACYANKKIIRMIESYDMYINHTVPKYKNQDLTWIYNILDHTAEHQKIIFENDNFVFLPDIKSDPHQPFKFYGLAIVKRRDLMSIRDLTAKEIPLLEEIRDICLNEMCKITGFEKNKFRAYFHYYPSYFHLHIHFNVCGERYDGLCTDYCWNLNTVIENLKLDPDYFKKVNIEVSINLSLT